MRQNGHILGQILFLTVGTGCAHRPFKDIEGKDREKARTSIAAFYRVREAQVRESIRKRAEGYAMNIETLHPHVETEDPLAAWLGQKLATWRRAWWMDLVRMETTALIQARHEGLRQYESGACVAAYRKGVSEDSSAGKAPYEAPETFPNEAALAEFVQTQCQNWGAELRTRDAAQAERLARILTGHPTFAMRLRKMAEAEAQQVDLGFRSLITP